MRLLLNNVYCEIEDVTEHTYNALVHTYTTFAPGAMFIKKNLKRHWDGRVYMVAQKKFLTGLLPEISGFLEKKNVIHTIVDNRSFITPSFSTTSVDLRDYQKDAINLALNNTYKGMWWPRGILRLATGAGKTETAVAMTQILPVPTLFVVHRTHLVTQVVERFAAYGIRVGVVASGKHDFSERITVATVQTLFSLLKDSDSINIRSYLPTVQQLFFDEAHLLAAKLTSGNMFTKVSNAFPNAFYRWGLTATPFMKDPYSNYLLKGTLGEELVNVSSKELIDQGHLADINITIDDLKEPMQTPLAWPYAYAHGIVLNKTRNAKIIEWANKSVQPVLILVNQVGHGDELLHLARKVTRSVEFVNGEHPNETRQRVIKELNSGKLKILIASTIFDEGVDIPNIQTLILAGAGKSPIKLLQRIGRGLRKSDTKHTINVIDFYDRMFPKLKEHSDQRIKVYEKEGFNLIRGA